MRRYILFSILLVTFNLNGSAQNGPTHELGFMIGGSYYLGDLNPYKHYDNTKFAGGVMHRINFNQRFSLKSQLSYGSVAGSDRRSESAYQQQRNLHFKSPLFEFSSQFEINFFNYALGQKKSNVSPYLFAGMGLTKISPQGSVNGQWVELQPLGTEGQGIENNPKKYNLTQLVMPFGFGLKANLGKFACIGLEFGVRKTFTDYLDDVSGSYVDADVLADNNGDLAAYFANQSTDGPTYAAGGQQRGNSQNKDWYVISGVFMTFKISKNNVCPKPL